MKVLNAKRNFYMKRLSIFLYFIILIAAYSCSATKNIPDNDALYMGAKVELKSKNDSVKYNKKDLEAELKDLVRPKPNARIFGIPYKVLIYNIVDSPKGKGLGYWLKYKVGEPPVLASQVNTEKNRAILENRLENNGFFRSAMTADTSIKNKKMEATSKGLVSNRYHIDTVVYETDSSKYGKMLARLQKNSQLKTGRPYTLDRIKAERIRIDTRLKERGFYYFNPDDLIVDADTTIGNYKVNMYLRTKEDVPDKAKEQFKINDVVVFADYNLQNDTSISRVIAQSKKMDGYYIYDPENRFNPKIFSRTLVFKPGDLYNRTAHNLSLNRLVNLGIYKFVKASFVETDTTPKPSLNAFYYLTPAKQKSIQFQVSGLTKSNNSTGTEVSLSWKNRNFFKGAELYTVRVFGGIEKQVSAQTQNVNTNRLGIDMNLYFPRVIGPVQFKTNSNFVPQTKLSLGYELFNRNTQYTLTSLTASAGYVWKEDITKEHTLNIFALNLVNPANITPEFQDSLKNNIALARSIEKQFIIGSNYNYNFNTYLKPNHKKNNYYFNGNLDLSGNIMGLVSGANVRNGNPKYIFGQPFSQYVRAELDFRHYLKINNTTTLASRIVTGLGYAYGNSYTMPFIKEFFAGGSSDIRAFRARSLGPGSYYAGNIDTLGFLPEQPGDVKLELNTELRAKLFSVIYGAVFLDAGNVWTVREDTTRPGSKFSNKFFSEMALGTGVGLRVDVSFFVLRLDVAFPLRKPFLPPGNRWVLNQIDFGSKDWRRQNLVFNLAIGYPF